MLYEIFDQVARENTTKSAIISDFGTITYGELLEKVYACSHKIGVVANDQKYIGVIADQEAGAVILALSLAAIGKVYVPVDPRLDSNLVEKILAPFTNQVIIGKVAESRKFEKLAVYKLDEITDGSTRDHLGSLKKRRYKCSLCFAHLGYYGNTKGSPCKRGCTIKGGDSLGETLSHQL